MSDLKALSDAATEAAMDALMSDNDQRLIAAHQSARRKYVSALVDAHRAGRLFDASSVAAQLKAADELAEAIDAYKDSETDAADTGLAEDYEYVFECRDRVDAALTAYRATKPTPE